MEICLEHVRTLAETLSNNELEQTDSACTAQLFEQYNMGHLWMSLFYMVIAPLMSIIVLCSSISRYSSTQEWNTDNSSQPQVTDSAIHHNVIYSQTVATVLSQCV